LTKSSRQVIIQDSLEHDIPMDPSQEEPRSDEEDRID
jgi:hypothetical protein